MPILDESVTIRTTAETLARYDFYKQQAKLGKCNPTTAWDAWYAKRATMSPEEMKPYEEIVECNASIVEANAIVASTSSSSKSMAMVPALPSQEMQNRPLVSMVAL